MVRVERVGDRIYLRGDKREVEQVAERVGGARRWAGGVGWAATPDVVLMLLDLQQRGVGVEIDTELVQWAKAWVREVLAENENLKLRTPGQNLVGSDGTIAWVHQQVDSEVLLERKRGILAYQVGLGKTGTAVMTLRGAGVKRAVVVVPKTIILLSNWQKEFARWFPEMRVIEAIGGTKEKVRTLQGVVDSERVAVLTNYEAFREDLVVELLVGWRPQALVLDEAHRLRGWKRMGAEFARGLVRFVKEGLVKDGLVLALTATPVVNGEWDLWGILRVLDPARFAQGGAWAFMERWFEVVDGPWGREIWGVKRKYEKLWSFFLSSIMIKRSAEEVGVWLPELVEDRVDVELSEWERELYRKLERRAYLELEELGGEGSVVFASNALAKLMRLRQLVLAPELLVEAVGGAEGGEREGEVFSENGDFDRCAPGAELVVEAGAGEGVSTKTRAVAELVGQIVEAGEKVVVYVVLRGYAKILERELRKELGERVVVRVSGDMDDAERREALERFVGGEEARVLVATVGVAGEGLNLQTSNARFTVFADLPWTFAQVEQAIGRLRRSGAKVTTVQVRYVVAKGTVEEHIYRIVCEKRARMKEMEVAVEVWRKIGEGNA